MSNDNNLTLSGHPRLAGEPTPGPWRVEVNTHTTYMPGTTKIQPVYKIERLHYRTNVRFEESEAAANARLMAAAPELLAAVENIECSECGHKLRLHADRYGCEFERGDVGAVAMGPCSCKGGECDQEAIAAIRKAKGEQ